MAWRVRSSPLHHCIVNGLRRDNGQVVNRADPAAGDDKQRNVRVTDEAIEDQLGEYFYPRLFSKNEIKQKRKFIKFKLDQFEKRALCEAQES